MKDRGQPANEWNDRDVLACFNMPGGYTITGRSTSIKNVFVASIIPVLRPKTQDIRKVLEILEQAPLDLRCSYCGDQATEWDHLRPLVKDGLPTGYPSSIHNLVPACGKCNQSKGKTDWKEWMLGSAPRSPTSRAIRDLPARIARLERYSAWANCTPIDIKKLVPPELWERYYAKQKEILEAMRESQKLAVEISRIVNAQVTNE